MQHYDEHRNLRDLAGAPSPDASVHPSFWIRYRREFLSSQSCHGGAAPWGFPEGTPIYQRPHCQQMPHCHVSSVCLSPGDAALPQGSVRHFQAPSQDRPLQDDDPQPPTGTTCKTSSTALQGALAACRCKMAVKAYLVTSLFGWAEQAWLFQSTCS